MIAFSPAKTRRLNVQLQELSIGDAIYLCQLPPERYEYGTTELLRRIVKPCSQPRVGQVHDIGKWTVQERAFVVAHYLAHTEPSGPDFSIGSSRYSDYIMPDKDAPQEVALGVIAGDSWRLVPLSGDAAESIERMTVDGRLSADRSGWWFGAMAAQMMRPGESLPEEDMEGFIHARAEVFKAYPERDFIELLSAFIRGTAMQDHLFRVSFDDSGIVFDQEVQGKPPARFPYNSAVTESTKKFFG